MTAEPTTAPRRPTALSKEDPSGVEVELAPDGPKTPPRIHHRLRRSTVQNGPGVRTRSVQAMAPTWGRGHCLPVRTSLAMFFVEP